MGERRRLRGDERITVCDNCFRASCWHGFFMCDSARGAGLVTRTVAQLRHGNYGEHEDWWLKQLAGDYSLGGAPSGEPRERAREGGENT